MKIKATVKYETIIDESNFYNELIENGYLPDEAKNTIISRVKEELRRIGNRAANIFWTPYEEWYNVEVINNET